MPHKVSIRDIKPSITPGRYLILTNNATGVPEYRKAVSADAGNDIIHGSDEGLFFQETLTSITGPVLTGGNLLQFTYNDEAGAANLISIDLSTLAIDINVLSITYNPVTGLLTVTETDLSTHTVTIGPATVTDTASVNLTVTGAFGIQADVNLSATAGNDLTIDGTGLYLNVQDEETTTSITGTLGAGNIIGTYNDEDGGATIIRETVTTIAGTLGAGNTIGTYNNEAGAAVIIRETITDFLLSGSTLRFVDEAGVNNDVTIASLISTDGGNAVSAGGDGKLYVSAGAAVANLSLANNTATNFDILIDTGTDVTLPASTNALAGLMTAAQFNNLANLIILSGVAANAQDLGTFTGVTIPDNQTIKQALQALETDLELQNLKFDILDEGVDTGAGEITSINIVGAGATATQIGGAVTITIPGGGEATTVSDTNSIDLTLTGVDITADLIVDPVNGNVLAVGAAGTRARLIEEEFLNRTDGTTTATLANTPKANTVVEVFYNGRAYTNFSVAANVVTFNDAASTPVNGVANDTDWLIRYWL